MEGAQERNRKSLTSEVLVFVNTGQIAFASWAYHRAAPSELWGGRRQPIFAAQTISVLAMIVGYLDFANPCALLVLLRPPPHNRR